MPYAVSGISERAPATAVAARRPTRVPRRAGRDRSTATRGSPHPPTGRSCTPPSAARAVSKIRKRLQTESVKVCRRRLRRILREAGLQRLHSPLRRPEKAYNGRIVTGRVDTMWGTDMTQVKTLEVRTYVFVAVDHCSSEIVGHHASFSATSREALEPVRMAVSRHIGGFGAGVADGPF